MVKGKKILFYSSLTYDKETAFNTSIRLSFSTITPVLFQ